MISVKIVVDNRLEKVHSIGLVKDAESVAGFFLAANYSSQFGLRVTSFETNFSRIVGISEL